MRATTFDAGNICRKQIKFIKLRHDLLSVMIPRPHGNISPHDLSVAKHTSLVKYTCIINNAHRLHFEELGNNRRVHNAI
jgi:hypothetical protein